MKDAHDMKLASLNGAHLQAQEVLADGTIVFKFGFFVEIRSTPSFRMFRYQ